MLREMVAAENLFFSRYNTYEFKFVEVIFLTSSIPCSLKNAWAFIKSLR